MRQNKQHITSIVTALGIISLSMGAWFYLTPHHVPELVFPSPRSVYEALLALRSRLFHDALITLVRVLAGLGIGVMSGIVVGILMTWSRTFYAAINPLIEAIRPIPTIALIPFFIVWFGLGLTGQIALVALGCFMVLTISTYVAVHNVSPIYIRAASALGASRASIYRTIIIPAILPSLLSGFRVAAALAFALAIAAEFMGAQSGIGFLIMVARRTLNTNTILLGIIIIGLESYLVDLGIKYLSRYLCRWSETPLADLQRVGMRT